MASSQVRFEFSALSRLEARVNALAGPGLQRVKSRTLSTIARRMPTEASRLISTEILHMSQRKVRKHLSVKIGARGKQQEYVQLRGSTRRIPLSEFQVSANRRTGVTASIWRDAPPYKLPHAFRIKGRGKAVWQRVAYNAANGGDGKTGGMVWRLPIVQRTGPAMRRAVFTTKHGNIIPPLTEISRQILRAEIARLLKVEGAR